MLKADGIVMIVESQEKFKIYMWHGKKFLKVNIEKTKIMRSATNEGPALHLVNIHVACAEKELL